MTIAHTTTEAHIIAIAYTHSVLICRLVARLIVDAIAVYIALFMTILTIVHVREEIIFTATSLKTTATI